jgi:hypothetical protein
MFLRIQWYSWSVTCVWASIECSYILPTIRCQILLPGFILEVVQYICTYAQPRAKMSKGVLKTSLPIWGVVNRHCTRTRMSLRVLEIGRQRENHKVLIYLEHHSVCPLVGIGTPPTPLPQASVPSPPPPGPKSGGEHSPAAKGVGESQFRRLEKKLSTLPTLWIEWT